jgi:hypothetical protein
MRQIGRALIVLGIVSILGCDAELVELYEEGEESEEATDELAPEELASVEEMPDEGGVGELAGADGDAELGERVEAPPVSQILSGETRSATLTDDVPTAGGAREARTYTVTETVVDDPEAEAEETAALAGVKAAAPIRCWQHHKNIRATTHAGVTEYRWQHLVRWCFKGNKPHKVKAHQGNNLGVGLYWEWLGNSRSDATRSSAAFWRYKQGHYRRCAPHVECHRNGYPAHSGSYKKGVVTNSRSWVR